MILTADNFTPPGPASDGALLARYAHHGDQQAFRDLVSRHIDWLYAAALRITRDPALAEDVTQGVLLALSRKAPALAGRAGLGGWLFQATRYGAVTVMRAESRRKERERMHMRTLPSASESPAWEDLKDRLDQAVGRLAAPDRQAIILRFYQRLSHENVAAALGISEDAARKRVARALERLRHALGVTASAPALGIALTGIPTITAPTHLVHGVLAGTVSAKVTLIAKGVSLMGITAKLKLALAILALAGFTGYLVSNQALGQPGGGQRGNMGAGGGPGVGGGSGSSMSAWSNGTTSVRRGNDGTHDITLTTTGGVTTALVKDAAGKVVFDGPYTTDADKAKVPADVAGKINALASPRQQQQWASPAAVDPQLMQQQLQQQLQTGRGQAGMLAGPGGGIAGAGIAAFVDPTTEMELVLTDLTDEQKSQLKDKAAAARQATADFRTQADTKIQELQQTGDQQAIQDARQTQQQDALALQFKNMVDVESVLTPDQRTRWESYLLAKQIKQKLQAAELTREQTDKIDAIAKDGGKDIVAATDVDARKKVHGSIYKKVLEDVLTEDQFGTLLER